MPGVEHRNITPLLQRLRTFLRGRPHKEALRFADGIAARDQPPPQIPGGPYHRTSRIYYYTRDARREVQPPIEVPMEKQIAAGSEATKLKSITPNKLYCPE